MSVVHDCDRSRGLRKACLKNCSDGCMRDRRQFPAFPSARNTAARRGGPPPSPKPPESRSFMAPERLRHGSEAWNPRAIPSAVGASCAAILQGSFEQSQRWMRSRQLAASAVPRRRKHDHPVSPKPSNPCNFMPLERLRRWSEAWRPRKVPPNAHPSLRLFNRALRNGGGFGILREPGIGDGCHSATCFRALDPGGRQMCSKDGCCAVGRPRGRDEPGPRKPGRTGAVLATAAQANGRSKS